MERNPVDRKPVRLHLLGLGRRAGPLDDGEDPHVVIERRLVREVERDRAGRTEGLGTDGDVRFLGDLASGRLAGGLSRVDLPSEPVQLPDAESAFLHAEEDLARRSLAKDEAERCTFHISPLRDIAR